MGNIILMPSEISDEDAEVGWTTVDEISHMHAHDESASVWTTVEDISDKHCKQALLKSAVHVDTARKADYAYIGELMPSGSDFFAVVEDATTPRPMSMRISGSNHQKSLDILESREIKKKIQNKKNRVIETKACIPRDVPKDYSHLRIGKSVGVSTHSSRSASQVIEFNEMNNERSQVSLTDGSQSWTTAAAVATKSMAKASNTLSTQSRPLMLSPPASTRGLRKFLLSCRLLLLR